MSAYREGAADQLYLYRAFVCPTTADCTSPSKIEPLKVAKTVYTQSPDLQGAFGFGWRRVPFTWSASTTDPSRVDRWPATTRHDAAGARLQVWHATVAADGRHAGVSTVTFLIERDQLVAAGFGTFSVPDQEPSIPRGDWMTFCGAPVNG